MKKVFISLFFLFGAFFSFAQFQLVNINCIVLIDSKLPKHLSGFVEYNNKFNQKDTAIFYYDVGMISFKTDDFEKLQLIFSKMNIITDTNNIIIHLNFSEWQKKYGRKTYHYYSSVPLSGLLQNDCIVLSITNFDKKKGSYYFDYVSFYDSSILQKPPQVGYNKKVQIFHDSNPYRPVKR